jgi:tRNA nucleotidyltransferase (CCA-adding enzyme)
MKLYQVGGSIRDELLCIKSNDIDFAVEADTFREMKQYIIDNNFTIFLEIPQYLTIRAKFPKDHQYSNMVADFTLCRIDGNYSDGRRPDEVKIGSIYDDLARRDFTINAIAKTIDGQYIDPYNGIQDLQNKVLKCVGNVKDKFKEDGLRALRAIRFTLTLNFEMDQHIQDAIRSDWLVPILEKISAERKKEELMKIFAYDTIKGINFFAKLPLEIQNVVFTNGLWLSPSLKKIGRNI